MEFSLFGLEVKRKQQEDSVSSVVKPENNDGSIIVDTSVVAGGITGIAIDFDASFKSESELIRRYRSVAMYSDCDTAIDEIINEMVISNDGDSIVEINLEDLKLSDSIKTKITEEFKTVVKLLKFNNSAYDLVRDWYIDGRLFHYIIINPDKPTEGIKELRYIDPRKIKKVKEVKKQRNPRGIDIVTNIDEYYIYNDSGISEATTANGVKLSKDSVVFTPSGIVDRNSGMVLSFLHKAIKPVNQLKYMEDSTVIYRITRAPERRIFYVDVGSMPKLKAEQYVNDLMAKYKNKIVYDANSGEVKDDRKHMSVMDDFWMPRRDGSKGTEITSLQGGQNLGEITDVEYFQKKLYTALNVPLSRLQANGGGGVFDMGRSSAISRDEVKFSKFIDRLRNKFSKIFVDTLKIQLITKRIISIDDWEQISDSIKFTFKQDNLYAEIKENDILTQRLATLQMVDNYVGKYVDAVWVRTKVLRQTEEEMKEIDKRMLDQRKAQLDFANHQGELEDARKGDEE